MKLHYRILWIDDNIEEFIELGIRDELFAFLEIKGFEPIIDCFEETSPAIANLQREKYDLILSDYNIDEKENRKEYQGDYLINFIREKEIFTEVLFYSAQANFNEIAMKLLQDRVSFFPLANDEAYKGFKTKVFKLVGLTVSKLEELNNIRGLVMSETSELDNTVEEILISFLSKGDEQSEILKSYILSKIEKSCQDNLEEVGELKAKDYYTIVKSRIFDSYKKSQAVNKLCKLMELKGEPFLNFHENYYKDVISSRNDLAHAKSANIDGIDYLIITRKGNEEPVKFNQEKCIEIRQNLRKHSSLLKEIRELIIR